jgi:hypothetical protein
MSPFIVLLFFPLVLASFRLKVDSLEITSPSIQSGQPIPIKYTLYGDNISPEMHISNIPAETQSLALILEDPDAVSGTWVHYLVKNIPNDLTVVKENVSPGVEMMNSFGYSHYGGPRPPQGSGIHRYFWRFYALDEEKMTANSAQEFRKEVDEHKVAEGFLMGTYEKI